MRWKCCRDKDTVGQVWISIWVWFSEVYIKNIDKKLYECLGLIKKINLLYMNIWTSKTCLLIVNCVQTYKRSATKVLSARVKWSKSPGKSNGLYMAVFDNFVRKKWLANLQLAPNQTQHDTIIEMQYFLHHTKKRWFIGCLMNMRGN
jgi:hypothetical protein